MLNRGTISAWILALLATVAISGCTGVGTIESTPSSTTAAPEASSGLGSGLYWRPSATPGGRWAMLLPGASGLKVFDDDQHYFRVAAALNARGVDVLVVDYKRAYKASPDRPNVPTGQKIAWVVERAVAWARQGGKIHPDERGAVIAWSLGAEGLWPLLAEQERAAALGVGAAVAYYPSNEDDVEITTGIPLLLLQGESDDVTPLGDLRNALRKSESPLVEVKTYPGAHHGFDIASIPEPRTVRLFPVLGPTGTFGYDAAAAREAWAVLAAFLDSHLPR